MSCGAFGGSGACGGGGGGDINASGFRVPRQFADRRFFDPFCIPPDRKACEPSCYFNPFVHAQCLGVNMNMETFRKDIMKCQEDYKKAVWAVLKKYAVGDDKDKEESNNANTSRARSSGRQNSNNANKFGASGFNINSFNRSNEIAMPGLGHASRIDSSDPLAMPMPTIMRRSASSGFRYDNPRLVDRVPMNYFPGGPRPIM